MNLSPSVTTIHVQPLPAAVAVAKYSVNIYSVGPIFRGN